MSYVNCQFFPVDEDARKRWAEYFEEVLNLYERQANIGVVSYVMMPVLEELYNSNNDKRR